MEILKQLRLRPKDENMMSAYIRTLSERLTRNMISNVMDIKAGLNKEDTSKKLTKADMEEASKFMEKIKFFCHLKMKIAEKDTEERGATTGGFYNPYPLPMIYFSNDEPSYYDPSSQEGMARAAMPAINPSPYSMDGGAFGIKTVQNMFSDLFRGKKTSPSDEDETSSGSEINRDTVKDMIEKMKLDIEIEDSMIYASISKSIKENLHNLFMYYKENYGSSKPMTVKALTNIVDFDPLFEHMSRIYHPSKK